jgi:hypothetical protein
MVTLSLTSLVVFRYVLLVYISIWVYMHCIKMFFIQGASKWSIST